MTHIDQQDTADKSVSLTVRDSSSSSSLYQALPFGVPGTGPIGPGRARHAVWGSAIWRASFAYGSAFLASHIQSMLLTETSSADASHAGHHE